MIPYVITSSSDIRVEEELPRRFGLHIGTAYAAYIDRRNGYLGRITDLGCLRLSLDAFLETCQHSPLVEKRRSGVQCCDV
jgi:hypothetical protein